MKEVDKKPKVTKPEGQKTHYNVNLDISGPVGLWMGLIAIAAIIQLVLLPFMRGGIVGPGLSLLDNIASYILYIPGIFILPMITALWIGSKVGSTQGTYGDITYRSIINALYVCIIYVIEIFMVFIISGDLHTGILSTVGLMTFVEFVIGLPILIAIIVVPLFALASVARRY